MLHFVFRWVAEEDRHGHILELWLRNSGRRDPEKLTELMVYEGRKTYHSPHDVPALSGALERLLGDETLRRRLGEAGRKRVEAHFPASAMTRRILEIYDEL